MAKLIYSQDFRQVKIMAFIFGKMTVTSKIQFIWAEEMAPQLRAPVLALLVRTLDALAKDLDTIPSTHRVGHNHL